MMGGYLASAILSEGTGWLIVIVLGVIWVALGVYWGRKATDSEGFMLAGRNVGLSLGSATAMATWVTSNTTMLAPVFALTLGRLGHAGLLDREFRAHAFRLLRGADPQDPAEGIHRRRLLPAALRAGRLDALPASSRCSTRCPGW